MATTEYRIVFSVQRCDTGDGDFTEIGFGSSTDCSTVDAAACDVESIIANRMWETGIDMPDPHDVEDRGEAAVRAVEEAGQR